MNHGTTWKRRERTEKSAEPQGSPRFTQLEVEIGFERWEEGKLNHGPHGMTRKQRGPDREVGGIANVDAEPAA